MSSRIKLVIPELTNDQYGWVVEALQEIAGNDDAVVVFSGSKTYWKWKPEYTMHVCTVVGDVPGYPNDDLIEDHLLQLSAYDCVFQGNKVVLERTGIVDFTE